MSPNCCENQVENKCLLLEKIGKTQFTVEWLLEALNENDEKWRKEMKSRTVKNISSVDISEGKGFISHVLKVSIEFADSEPDYSVVLKVPSMDAFEKGVGEMSEDVNHEKPDLKTNESVCAMFQEVHVREMRFYSKYSNVAKLPVPRVFKMETWSIADNKEGAILMECLTDVATTGELFTGFTHEQVLQILPAITHFQAHVLAADDRSWTESSKQSLFSMDDDKMFEMFMALIEKSVEDRPRCKEMFNRMSGPFHDKQMWPKSMTAHEKIGVSPVLVHGDLWTNNIMWKKNADGTPSNELQAIIDWQIFRAGGPADDFARLLVNCCDGEYRRKHEYELLEQYYEDLCSLLEEKGKKPPFTKEEVLLSYRLAFVYQTVMLVGIIPMFLRAQQTAQEESEKKIWKEREDRLWLRAQFALEDAVEYLEAYFPELL